MSLLRVPVVIRILVAGALSLLVLAAPAMAQITITHYNFAGHGAGWTDYLKDRAKAFEELHPGIKVEIVTNPGNSANYVDEFVVALAGGAPPNSTDFHAALAGGMIGDGFFTDLRPYLERDGIVLSELTVPPVVEILTAPNGSIWSLAGDIFPVVTFYNVDMFEEAGLPSPNDLGDDWTWERAIESGRLLTQDLSGDGITDQWGIEAMGSRWYMWVHQAGGMLYDRIVDPTESRWNTPEVITGFDFPISVFRAGISPAYGSPEYSAGALARGTAAMTFKDGPGAIGARLTDVPFRWDIAPQVRGPKNAGSEIAVSGFQMVAAAENQEETWEWLKFISFDYESMLKFMEYTGRVPHLLEAAFEYNHYNPHAPEHWRAFLDVASLPETLPNYVIPQSVQINGVINPLIMEVFTGQTPIESAVEEIHTRVSAFLRERHGE